MAYARISAKKDAVDRFNEFCKANKMSKSAGLALCFIMGGRCDKDTLDKLKTSYPTRGDAGRERYMDFLQKGGKLFNKLEMDIINLVVYCERNDIRIGRGTFEAAAEKSQELGRNKLTAGPWSQMEQRHAFETLNQATAKQWLRALLNCAKRKAIVHDGYTYTTAKKLQLSGD